MRTVCAFANDFENEGSGYVIVGVEEKDGKPIRPVKGFNPEDFEAIQKEMIGYCNLIQPTYFPNLSLEVIDGKNVMVIWVMAGVNRPYKVPDDVLAKNKTYNYRIRQYSSTIVPNQEQETELVQLTAKIPFDDRVNQKAKMDDLSFALMREHLEKTKSKLFGESARMSVEELAHQMNLTQGANEHLFTKNVSLLMFSNNPQKYFKGAQIDLVEFPDGVAGKNFTEKIFRGPIQQQLVDVLAYFKSHIIKERITKFSDREESDRVYNYPYEAIEEALSNAVYHRNYELQEPIEVRVLPQSIEIISFSGADPSLKQTDFEKGTIRTRRYRNSRIGEFLKELRLTEGRGTGIPTIINELKQNGSPEVIFETDEPDRRHFIVEIPIHFAFMVNEEGNANDQVTDQVIASINYQIISKLNEFDHIQISTPTTSSDQVSDQVDETEKMSFIIHTAALLDRIKKLHEFGYPKPSPEVVEKYTESAIAITEEQWKILQFSLFPKSNKEQEEALGLKNHTDNFKNHVEPLLNKGYIARTIPNKPTSSSQKYFTTEKGKIVANIRNELMKE
jgi:ATP-dependent DNA helicase RecG